MLISECHVGDKVVGLPHSPYGYTCAGWIGYITNVSIHDICVSDAMHGAVKFPVDPRYFAPVSEAEIFSKKKEKEEVDIMSIINENERRILLSEMEDLLDEYNYNYSSKALNKIIDEWATQKETLIKAFKTHPNYLEGKFMIAFDVDYERGIKPDASYTFSEWLFAYNGPAHQMMDNLPKELAEQKRSDQYLPNELWEFLYEISSIAARTIAKETAEELNALVPAVRAHTGEKTSRVINRLCTYLGYNKHPEYNREFAKYADSLSPLIIKRHTILSLNPLDYLTMSFGNSWASCHTIDKRNKRGMPNSYEGQYSSGTMSYMLDGASMVLYTVDSGYNGNDYWTQPKINRQMYHWGEDKLVQGRLYPQSCDYEDAEYIPYRNVVQQIISDIFKFPNLWSLTKGSSAASKYILTEGTHYPDYSHFSNCTLSRVKGSENEEYFTVGADPICIECGYTHDESECISCCSNPTKMECDDCGCDLDSDDAICIDGRYYCRDCVNYCECCNEYHRSERYYIPSEGIYVCESCFDEYYTYCERCGRNVDRDDTTYVESEGEPICDRCLERHYFQCDECGEYFRNENRNQLCGRHLCDDCYDEATEDEDENEEEAC